MDYPNILHEPILVHDLDEEYLKLINYYTQIKRSSIFVEYYNINDTVTSYNDNLFSTFDDSNLHFDKYRLTPLYNITPVSNNSENDTNNAGDVLSGETSIVINTIKIPKINDLIRFYPPHEKSEEIFRVSNISTISYAIHATPNVNWFNLTLSYAPRETYNNLSIYYDYIFDTSINKNIKYSEYQQKIKKLSEIDIILKKLKPFYSSYFDLYCIDGKVPFITNNNIWKLKSEHPILNCQKPYGFKDITNIELPCDSILNIDPHYYDYFDLNTKTIETYYLQNLNNQFELIIRNSLVLGRIINDNI